MTRIRRLSALAVLSMFCLLTNSCGGDSTGPSDGLRVVISSAVTSVLPGQTIGASVHVSGNEHTLLDSVVVHAIGLFSWSNTYPLGLAAPQAVVTYVPVPLNAGTGMLTIRATAYSSSGSAKAELRVAVADTTPPFLDASASPQRTLQTGDTVTVSFTAIDLVAIKYTTVKFSGSFEQVDSTNMDASSYPFHIVKVQVPPNASLTKPLHIEVRAVNVADLDTTAVLHNLSVKDTVAPTLSGSVVSTHAGAGTTPGDTLHVSVRAVDRRKLAYVGYRFGPPANTADSVVTADSMAGISSTIVIPASWAGTTSYSMFAADSAGNHVTIPMGELTVATRTRNPVATIARPGPIQDAAIDLKRGVVYLSIPDQKRVAVLSLSDKTFAAPIDFTFTPRGLDLTNGGDSLLVALLERGDVGVVNLATRAMTYLPVTDPYGPEFLRVMSTNRFLLTTTFAGSGFGGTVTEVDLATGAKRAVATVTEVVPLASSGNRGRILIFLGDDSGLPTMVYDAASQSIIADRGTVGMNSGAESVDFSGTRFMMSSTVYDEHLNSVATYQSSSYNYGASQLALNGQSGYFATEAGIEHVRFSDGALLESFALPEQPYAMWLSRDGLTLIAAGATNVYVIDLW